MNNSDPNGYFVVALSASFGGAIYIRFNVAIYFLIDSRGNQGILVSGAIATGLSAFGSLLSLGIYWKYKTIDDFVNSNTISHSIGVDGTITFVNNVDKHFNVSLSGLETNILGAGLGYLYTAVPGIFYFYEFKNRHIAWQVYDFIKNLFK